LSDKNVVGLSKVSVLQTQ